MRSARRKGFKHYFKKLFHRRNIIVMSADSVDHYPISGWVQMLILCFAVIGFSWVSYSTGSYMASQHVMAEKDRLLASTAMQKRKIGEEYSLLKHDLKKLQEREGKLSEYAKFVLEQHDGSESIDLNDSTMMDAERLGKMKSRLLERISYLEERLALLEEENHSIVTMVLERSQKKIKELNDIISQTGLNTSKLVERAKKDVVVKDPEGDDFSHQGGPYIPDTVQELAPDLIDNIDEVLALQHVVSKLPLAKPLHNARTSSRFGRRSDPFTRRPAMHSGQDFVGHKGQRIVATANGRVKQAGKRGAYGNMVIPPHGCGITTRYAHLSKISVQKGQIVKKGQQIGNQGTTGRSTGEHLHYEVRYHGRAINPMKFIKAGRYVQ